MFIITLLSFLLASCSSIKLHQEPGQFLSLENPPLLKVVNNKSIYLGGLSGLAFAGRDTLDINENSVEDVILVSLTDRGPNGEPSEIKSQKQGHKIEDRRPFYLPDFNPQIVKLKIKNKKLTLIEQLLLRDPKGVPLTGLPNYPGSKDEIGTNLKFKKLKADLMGIDPESIAIDADGNYWIGEEYRPSIMKFDSSGNLLKKFVPQNSYTKKDENFLYKKYGRSFLQPILPKVFNQRKLNRGFEALTFYDGKIYVLTQSPLIFKDQKNTAAVRLLVLDTATEKLVGEYVYQTDNSKIKLGDLTVNSQGQFYIIEQDGKTGGAGLQLIYKFDLKNATDILNKNDIVPELMSSDELSKTISPIKKTLALDLNAVGYNFAEKVEGLTFINPNTIGVINDNDFGLENNQVTNRIPSTLGIFKISH